jgi:hypothetical protein
MKLAGITRPAVAGTPFKNPNPHSGAWGYNRLTAEVVGPDGQVKQRLERRNVMATAGLTRLAVMLSSDTDGASKWCSAMAIGTGTTAANSTQDSLVASTQIIHLSQASMVASNPGARTLQYNGTFASNGNAAAINEVGLFATNAATAKMIARSVLGTDSINRGTADEIRISYQVIFGTA